MKIQVYVTNNAGGPSGYYHDHESLTAAHDQAESINDWTANQYRGSYAIVLVDGVEQETRAESRHRDDIRMRQCGL